MTVTTSEAAELVGVSEATIWKWKERGYLAPVRENAKPLRFREQDVIEADYRRRPSGWHVTLDRLADDVA